MYALQVDRVSFPNNKYTLVLFNREREWERERQTRHRQLADPPLGTAWEESTLVSLSKEKREKEKQRERKKERERESTQCRLRLGRAVFKNRSGHTQDLQRRIIIRKNTCVSQKGAEVKRASERERTGDEKRRWLRFYRRFIHISCSALLSHTLSVERVAKGASERLEQRNKYTSITRVLNKQQANDDDDSSSSSTWISWYWRVVSKLYLLLPYEKSHQSAIN